MRGVARDRGAQHPGQVRGQPADVAPRRLERESEQTIRKTDIPDGLRVLLRANLAEHRGLGEMTPPVGALPV